MIYSEINGFLSSKIILGRDFTSKAFDKNIFLKSMDVYAEKGGNHLDTAHLYCDGESETLIGQWLKGKAREKFIVTTKGGHAEGREGYRLCEKYIEKDLDESLMRLSLDYADIYLLHRDDEAVAAGELIEAMNRFVKKGKIKSFGCSNWKRGRIEEANRYAAEKGLLGFSVSQIKYSPAVTSPDYEDDPALVEMNDTEYEFYKKSNIPVMAFASQGKGFFIKAETGNFSEKCRKRYYCEENLRRYEKIKNLAQEKNVSVTAIALAFLYCRDIDVFPIIGGSSPEQIADSLKFSDFTLTQEEILYIETGLFKKSLRQKKAL